MGELFRVPLILDLIFLSVATLCALIYLIPITFVRRFHTVNNILTSHVCINGLICCLFWITFNVISVFYPSLLMPSVYAYVFSSYFPSLINCLVVYSSTMVTVNRYLTIIHPNKRFFKGETWAFLSSTVERILAIILPLPFLILCIQECIDIDKLPYWTNIYNLVIIVILPSALNTIFNLLIFLFVRSSVQRVHTIATAGKVHHRNTRDIYLLKHMFFVSIIFMIGWAPIYILRLSNALNMTPGWIQLYLEILPVISSIIIILDLFYYNRDLRQYLREKLFQLFR